MANELIDIASSIPATTATSAILDSRQFVAPRSILEMYQKISFGSFKVWASLINDISEKDFSDKDQYMPLSLIWQTLDGRLSQNRLEVLLDELQTTLVKKEEYLPQTKSRSIQSFTMLGPTEITVNVANDVTSLKCRFVSELLQLLRSDVDREKFVIEMRTIISLKGAGGEHAKNLLLFCTPHVHNGMTDYIDINELRLFMGLNKSYVDENGETVSKTFTRDVLKKGVAVLTANPYISFNITKIEKTKDKINKKTLVRFRLEERRSLQTLLSETVDDQRTPLDPNKLRVMLVNFWTASIHGSPVSYAPEILVNLLMQFRFVDKYVNEFVDIEAYNEDPVRETYKIFSIGTAVTQLWLDGRLEKQGSKIYNYAYSVFKKPKENQINSLCKKFVTGAGLSLVKQELDSKSKSDLQMQKRFNVIQLDKGIKSYRKVRVKKALNAFSREEMVTIDEQFYLLSKQGKFGTWAKKASDGIEVSGLLEKPLFSVLTRRTLALYKIWLSKQAVVKGKCSEESLEEYYAFYPDYKRYSVDLNIPLEVDFLHFETLVESIKSKFSV